MARSVSLKDTFKQISKSSYVEKGYMILLLVTVFPLTYKIISPFMIIAGLGAYTKYITCVLYIVGVLLAFPHIRRTIKPPHILCYLLFAVFFILSQLIYPLTASFVNDNMHDVLLYVVPVFFIGLLVDYQRDAVIIKNTFRIAFIIAVFWELCLMIGLVDIDTSSGDIGEQMDVAYYMLVINCYMLIEYNKSHDRFELVSLILGSFILLLMGTRGPVVLWVLFWVIYCLFFHTFYKSNAIKKLLVVLLLIVFYVFSKPIMIALSLVAVKLGMSTKIFDSFLKGSLVNIDQSSGRDVIYNSMWKAINSDVNCIGYGFGGDRLFSPSGGYAHNLFLEVLVEFGYIGGSIFFLFLTFILVRAYRKVRGTTSAEFLLVIFFWGIMSLFFSKSWIIHPGFFFMIGYLLSILRNHRGPFIKV